MSVLAASFLKRSRWQQVLLITLAAISFMEISGLVGTKVIVARIGWGNGLAVDSHEKADSWAGRFARWDSGYYLGIAEGGYRHDGTEIAFFPFYPLLIRLLNRALGLSLLCGAAFISTVCFIAATTLAYRWVMIDCEPDVAGWTVLWMCVFPMSFVFVSVLPESLFLLASVACIYFARRGHFIASGLAIAVAGATRSSGFLLAIPYILEFSQQGSFSRARWFQFALGAFIAPLGLLSYAVFLSHLTGRTDVFTLYSSVQANEWKRSITFPWVTLADGFRAALFGEGLNPDRYSRIQAWQDLSYALFGLGVAVWALFRLRLSAAVFLLASVLFFFSNHGPYGYAFWSVPRYITSVAPLFPAMALLTVRLPSWLRWLAVMFSLGLLGGLSAWYASGRWIA